MSHRFTVVNTVNTPLNRQYDFGIHAADCADLRKGTNRSCQHYPHVAEDAFAVRDAERADLAESFGEEPGTDLGFTFRVFPCCENAPVVS